MKKIIKSSILVLGISLLTGCSVKNETLNKEEVKSENYIKIKINNIEEKIDLKKEQKETLKNITYFPKPSTLKKYFETNNIKLSEKKELMFLLKKEGTKVDIEYEKKEINKEDIMILTMDVENYKFNNEEEIQETISYTNLVVLEKNKEYKKGDKSFIWIEK